MKILPMMIGLPGISAMHAKSDPPVGGEPENALARLAAGAPYRVPRGEIKGTQGFEIMQVITESPAVQWRLRADAVINTASTALAYALPLVTFGAANLVFSGGIAMFAAAGTTMLELAASGVRFGFKRFDWIAGNSMQVIYKLDAEAQELMGDITALRQRYPDLPLPEHRRQFHEKMTRLSSLNGSLYVASAALAAMKGSIFYHLTSFPYELFLNMLASNKLDNTVLFHTRRYREVRATFLAVRLFLEDHNTALQALPQAARPRLP